MSDQKRFCEVCNCEIDSERAETLKTTRLCGRHAEEIKKYGGEFLGTGEHVNVGKVGNTRTGGVSVTFRRNQQGIERLKDDHDREVWEKRKQQTQKEQQKPQEDTVDE